MAPRPIVSWHPMGIRVRTGQVLPMPWYPVAIAAIVSRHPDSSFCCGPRIFPVARHNVPFWGYMRFHPDKVRPWFGRFGMAR